MRQPTTRFAALFVALAAAGWSAGGRALAQDAKGDWHGAITVAPGLDLRLAIHLKAAPGGGLAGTMDSPDQGRSGIPLADVRVRDGKLAFTDTLARGSFSGAWSATDRSWKGVFSNTGRAFPVEFLAGDLPPSPVVQGLDGEWDGASNIGQGRTIRFAFHIVTDARGTHATFDNVDSGVYGLGVSSVSRTGNLVRLELSKQSDAFVVAQLSSDGNTLAGALVQENLPLPLTLKRLAAGQAPPWPKPAGALDPGTPLPADWRTPSDADIRQLLVRRIDTEQRGLGAVVGIIDAHGRRIIVYGKSDTSGGRPLDGDTEFETGSISKVFTNLILADMVRRGEVKLDDPISLYLPAGVTAPQKDGKAITLVDLATHTSGLPRDATNIQPDDPNNPFAGYSDDRLWAFLSHYQLTRDPGAKFEYSNLGVGLLGELLARRAGTDYATLLKRRVLAPLGMHHTGVALSPQDAVRLAPGYDTYLRPAENIDMGALAGAGSIRSSANDMLTFLAAEMGLSPTPLKADIAETLAVRRPIIPPDSEQALGWEVVRTPNGDIVWHNGGTYGYRAYAAFNQKTRVGVVVLTNTGGSAGADDIGQHILTGAPVAPLPRQAPPPPERHAVTLDEKALDALTGSYQLAPQVTATIVRDGGRLFAQLTGQPRYEVFPESPTAVFWKVVDAQATFTLGPDGRATTLTLHQNGRDLPAPRTP